MVWGDIQEIVEDSIVSYWKIGHHDIQHKFKGRCPTCGSRIYLMCFIVTGGWHAEYSDSCCDAFGREWRQAIHTRGVNVADCEILDD
jgi:hypothetical protein